MISIAACCAYADGHATAAPPSSVMNSRRPMSSTGLPPPLWTGGTTNDYQPADRPMQSVCSGYHGGWVEILGTVPNCSESRSRGECRPAFAKAARNGSDQSFRYAGLHDAQADLQLPLPKVSDARGRLMPEHGSTAIERFPSIA